MSLIQEFTAQPGETEKTFMVQKTTQELRVKRVSTVAVLLVGLVLGFPEKVSAEITNPVRKRVTGSERIPLSHIAAWGQHGRGPIVESAAAAGLADVDFGEGGGTVAPARLVTTEIHYYLNQVGPMEIATDDQMAITITGLVPGASYKIYAPGIPVNPATAQQMYVYEQSLILPGDREKTLYTSQACGLILPNAPTKIVRFVFAFLLPDGTEKEETLLLEDLLAVQSDANPFYGVMSFESEFVNARSTVLMPSGKSDLLVVSLNHVTRVEVHTVLGEQVEYTLVKVVDRNNA
jgi:hypothetical protein